MIPYLGGDEVGAIVADFGHYSTKMGFAGEDNPRAWFRSEVAVQRSSSTTDKDQTNNPSTDNSTSIKTSIGSPAISKYTNPITAIQYDYLTRPLDSTTGKDGTWDTFNPIDPLTGLLRHSDNPYHTPKSKSSSRTKSSLYNSNANSNTKPSSHENMDDPDSDTSPLWTHLFAHGMTTALLASEPILTTPILFVEPSYNPPQNRQITTEILFETLQAPAVFMGRDAVLSCYACGKTTGVVVDMGSLFTTVSPVYDGFVEQRGVIQCPIGARTGLDEWCLKRLDIWNNQKANKDGKKKAGVAPLYQVKNKGIRRSDHFHRLCRLDMARNLRESIALTADMGYDPSPSTNSSSEHQQNNAKHLPKLSYKLPDGTHVEIECEERYNIPELWFGRDDENTLIREESCRLLQKRIALEAAAMEAAKAAVTASSENESSSKTNQSSHYHTPQHTADNTTSSSSLSSSSFTPPPISSHPLPNIICDAAFQCDRDQQAQLLANVLLSGGGSCIDNLPERIRDEVEGIIHTHTPGWKVKVLSPPIPERSVSAWLGGSILASLGSFGEMWMTKKEYEESGSGIVNRKCP